MDWLKELIEKHTVDGKTEIDVVMNAFKEEFPKHAVPKDVYNEQAEKLKAANSTLDTLKKTNKDAEGLQQKITDYEAKVQQLETERSEERKTYALKEALTKEGALPEYVDLLMPTLKGVELDADGNLNGFEDIFKGIKESKPALFKTEQTQTNPAETNGYKVIDNKLDSGKQGETQPKSLAEAIQLSYENKQ